MSDDRFEESRSAENSSASSDSHHPEITNGKESYARSLNDQGVWFVTAGRPHLAVRCFRRACVAWPLMTAAWTNMAATLSLLGRSKDAMTAIREAVKAGAMTRSIATRCRATIRQSVSPDQLTIRRHAVQGISKEDAPARRPTATRKRPLRKNASIYTLLRTAAYDMICERKIPVA